MFHRLTQRLLEIGPVFAHLDAKSDFSGWAHNNPDVVFLDNRVKVYWGHWSMVEATTRLLERVLTNDHISRITLVSGSHYLLRSPAEIATRAVSGDNVIAARRAPNMPDGSRPEIEYRRRFVASKNPDSLAHKVANAFVNRVVFAGRPLEWRDLVASDNMRAGSQYWSLTRVTAEYIVHRIRSNDDLIRYFKKINCADEKVFATLFAEFDSSPHLAGTTFVKWAQRANPESVTREDLEQARRNGQFWFARKFDSTTDVALLDWLDDKTEGA
jgi:hypothetical protein